MTKIEICDKLHAINVDDKMRITLKNGEIIDTEFVNVEWYDDDIDEDVAYIYTTDGIFDGYEFESMEPLNSDGGLII